jgi:CRISPR-associated protein Cas1
VDIQNIVGGNIMKKDIYIFKSGDLKRKDNTIYFQHDEGKKYLPVEEIDNLYIFGEINLNKKVLDFLSQNEICIHFFNYYGYYSGTYYPREHLNSGYVILKQAENYLNYSKRIYIAINIIKSAINNILNNLKYYNRKNIDLKSEIEKIENNLEKLDNCSTINEIMAHEGNTRNIYYECFNKIIINKDYEFTSRTRRPPKDKINALISFGNSLMYSTVLSQIYKTHLDPRIGYLHSTNERRFTLNLDIAEIFKPIIVDRMIFSMINKNILSDNDYIQELNGILLNENGRKKLLTDYNKRLLTVIIHPNLKRQITYKTIIKLELYKIQRFITEEEQLNFFKGRW